MTISTAAPIQVPAPIGQKASNETSIAAGPVVEDAEVSPGAIAFARILGNRPRMMLRPDAKEASRQSRASFPASQIRQRHHVWSRNVQVCRGIFRLIRLPREADSLWQLALWH